MTDQKFLRIPYRIPKSKIVQAIAVFLVLTLIFAYFAFTNHSGIHLNDIVSLSPSSATIFYWMITIFIPLQLTIRSICVAFFRRSELGYIEIREDSLFVPEASISAKMISMPFNEITSAHIGYVRASRFISVKSLVGESRLLEIGFLSLEDFEDFFKQIQGRIA